MSIDSFLRLRTSKPFTTFNYYPTLLTANSNLDEDVWVSVGNSQSYNSSNYINLPVNTGLINYSLRHSKLPMVYQSGKSRLIYITGVLMSTLLSTTTSYMGTFNVNDLSPPSITEGMYIGSDGVNLFFGEVTQTGTTNVNQSSWNIDTFDGNGPSGQTLTIENATKTMLVVFDQEWLGVGRIRCGFYINGVLYYAHQFLHNNYTVQYTATPRLRLCYYIKGTVSNSMRQMCSTCMSEGGYYSTGKCNNISTTTNGVTLTSSGIKYIVLALKIQPTYTYGSIALIALSNACIAASNKIVRYQIQLHSSVGSVGAISGTFTYTDLIDSIAQYSIGDGSQTITTDGYIVYSGFITSQSDTNLMMADYNLLLTRNTISIFDTLYVVCTGNVNSETMYSSVNFIEEI